MAAGTTQAGLVEIKITSNASEVLSELDKINDKLKSMQKVKPIASSGGSSPAKAIGEAVGQTNKLKTAFGKVNQTVTKYNHGLQKAYNVMFSMRTLAGLLGAGFIVKDIVSVGIEFDRINASLKAIVGTSEEVIRVNQMIDELSNSIGLRYKILLEQYTKFRAAAQYTGMPIEEIDAIYKAVSKGAAVFQLSAEDTYETFRALTQMLSKGTISAEELRGQFGERIPGALALMAQSLNITISRLLEMMENGELLASEVLPKMGKEFEDEFGEKVKEISNSSIANINRFYNNLDKIRDKIAKSGLLDGLVRAMDKLNKAMADESKIQVLKQTGAALGEIIVAITEFATYLASLPREILGMLMGAMLGGLVGGGWGALIGGAAGGIGASLTRLIDLRTEIEKENDALKELYKNLESVKSYSKGHEDDPFFMKETEKVQKQIDLIKSKQQMRVDENIRVDQGLSTGNKYGVKTQDDINKFKEAEDKISDILREANVERLKLIGNELEAEIEQTKLSYDKKIDSVKDFFTKQLSTEKEGSENYKKLKQQEAEIIKILEKNKNLSILNITKEHDEKLLEGLKSTTEKIEKAFEERREFILEHKKRAEEQKHEVDILAQNLTLSQMKEGTEKELEILKYAYQEQLIQYKDNAFALLIVEAQYQVDKQAIIDKNREEDYKKSHIFYAKMTELADNFATSFSNNFDSAFMSFIEGTKSLGESFSEMAVSILKDMATMYAKKAIMDALFGSSYNNSGGKESMGGLLGAAIGAFANKKTAANGAIFQGGFKAFANGGVVNQPTLGYIGEGIYNEAVVPLPDGKKIPVDMKGVNKSNNFNINVNVDGNKGGTREQNDKMAKQIAREIREEVKGILLDEKRYGGVLGRRAMSHS